MKLRFLSVLLCSTILITLFFNITGSLFFFHKKPKRIPKKIEPLPDITEKYLTITEKRSLYKSISKDFLLQQSCGTNFTSDFWGIHYGQSPEVLTDIIPNYPIVAPISEVRQVIGNVLIIVHDETSVNENHWWIRLGKSHKFNIDINHSNLKQDFVDLLKQFVEEGDKKWIFIVDQTTYVILTNLLSFVTHECRHLCETEEDLYYFGYPFQTDVVKEFSTLLFAPLRAGILLNRYSAKRMISDDFLECPYSFDICVGFVMYQNGIRLIDLDTLLPEPPEVMLQYLDDRDLIPDYFQRVEMKESVYNRPITFGNMRKENMHKLQKIQKIPKILHQIWIGDQSKRPPYIANCKSMYESNGWRHYLWTDENIDEFQSGLINRKLYNSFKEYPARADLLRMEILFKYGGFVIDADSDCFRTMDDVIEETYARNFQIAAACENETYRPGLYAVGVQGSAPYSLSYYILLRSLHLVKNSKLLYKTRKSISWIITGPLFFTGVINNFNLPINVINSCMVYPIHWIDFKKEGFDVNFDVEKAISKCDSFTFQYWGSTKSNYHKFLKIKRGNMKN